jgi:type III secretion protein T
MSDLSQLNDFFSSFVRPILLGAPRAFGMLAVFPLLPAKLFPTPVRNGIAIALVLPAYPLLRSELGSAPDGTLAWLLFVIKEIAIGAGIGWAFGMLIWAVETVGALLEIQTGTATGGVFDPISNQQAAVYTQWLRDTALILFLVLGGFLAMTHALHQSYVVWPVTEGWPQSPQQAWANALTITGKMLALGLTLALPLIICLLIIELGLGLLNRSLPQLNVFAVSMPLKMLGAMFGFALIVVYYIDILAYQIPRIFVPR